MVWDSRQWNGGESSFASLSSHPASIDPLGPHLSTLLSSDTGPRKVELERERESGVGVGGGRERERERGGGEGELRQRGGGGRDRHTDRQTKR